MAATIEEISYSAQDLEEIERIVSYVSSANARGSASGASASDQSTPTSRGRDGASYGVVDTEGYSGEPDDLDLPPHRINAITGDEPTSPDGTEDITSFLEEAGDEPGEIGEPIEDITGLVEEVESSEDAQALPGKKSSGKTPDLRGLSPLEQLETLTRNEPASLDIHELAPNDSFVDQVPQRPTKGAPAKTEQRPIVEEEEPVTSDELAGLEDLPDIGDFGDIEAIGEPEETGRKAPAGPAMSLEGTSADDIPDLNDISMVDSGSLPETADDDIPDIDLSDLGGEAEPARGKQSLNLDEEMGGISDDDLSALSEAQDLTEDKRGESRNTILADFGESPARHDQDDLGPLMTEKSAGAGGDEPFEIEMLDDEPPAKPAKPVKPAKPAPRAAKAVAEAGAESVELTDREIKKLKNAILLYNPALRQAIKDTVLQELIPVTDIRDLVDMIIAGKPEQTVQRFLEKKLDRTIESVPERAKVRHRVITARPEYTTAGRERQKKLLKVTGIAGIVALVTCIVTLVGYQYFYKPWMAERTIRQGVALILQPGDYSKKPRDYGEAEKLFSSVHENYVPNYLPGYTEYARAYFKNNDYTYALQKLNKAYGITTASPVVLNELGYFYSKVPEEYYRSIKGEVNGWYFKGKKVAREPAQLDLAIELYRRTLVLDPKNVKAMYGVGNAYFFQGHYLKAKKYYEDILRVDSKSVVGYSGLLNLYIERDAFAQVVAVNTELREKDLLTKVDSPLLAKLAGYYLSKAKTDTFNVRVDYGVQSPRFKDQDDNIWPAVQSVLAALNKRDPKYPPLHLQTARLARAQQNYRSMKLSLERALEEAPNYYGALHLMGEYYYYTKDPVRAYQFLNKAIKAQLNPPDFTKDDFYAESESTGKSYALMGNIFYYFFDRIKARFGSLDEELEEGAQAEEMEKMANYTIARDRYEKALEEKYESPELRYNLGRVYYLNRLYNKALDQWLHLYEDFVGRPELIFALGNAFYHLGKLDASKGEYLKMISVFEHEADRISRPNPGNDRHVKIYQSLASAYNNLGAVYQAQQNERKSTVSFWKAIDYNARIDREMEYARVNLARAVSLKGQDDDPIIDEGIPYSVDIYREDMRK